MARRLPAADPTPASGLSRRGFLLRGLALGCSAAASPLMTPITLASVPGETRLVVIILRGAMDGLDVIRPLGDPDYAALRPGFGQSPGAHALDNFFALHPDLGGLMPLWQAGEFGAVHAVSTPYRDRRSHFDGQDLLEAGTGADLPPASRRDGWLNRALQRMAAAGQSVESRTAFAVGQQASLILQGSAPATVWAPGADMELTPQSRLLLDHLYAADPLFRDAAATATELAAAGLPDPAELDEDEDMAEGPMMAEPEEAPRPGSPEGVAQYVAEQLHADTRIASFSLGGWDTHRGQQANLRAALRRLEATLLTLRDSLGPVWGQTAVMALTEFGRTARENGTAGTDHGTGGAMLLAGGALRGGKVHGLWPGLGDGALYQQRDLMPTRDVRAHAAWALHGLMGLSHGDLENTVFPGLDMENDPGLLA